MIEVSRYVLALVVAEVHLWPLGASWTGHVAVFAFYTLSGYLMTKVLNERYGFSTRGTVAFLLNRVLRLWPAYLVILGLTLTALLVLPLANFYPQIRMPRTAAEIISNITILGQATFDYDQWMPLARPTFTSWSLSIEVFCYLLLAAYFARTPRRLWGFAVIGAIAIAFSTWHCGYCFANRYNVLQAGFIPFAMGGLFYFHRSFLSACIKANWRTVIALLIAAQAAMLFSDGFRSTVDPYLGIAVMFCLLSVSPGPIRQQRSGFRRQSLLSSFHRAHADRRCSRDWRWAAAERSCFCNHRCRCTGTQRMASSVRAQHQRRAPAHRQPGHDCRKTRAVRRGDHCMTRAQGQTDVLPLR